MEMAIFGYAARMDTARAFRGVAGWVASVGMGACMTLGAAAASAQVLLPTDDVPGDATRVLGPMRTLAAAGDDRVLVFAFLRDRNNLTETDAIVAAEGCSRRVVARLGDSVAGPTRLTIGQLVDGHIDEAGRATVLARVNEVPVLVDHVVLRELVPGGPLSLVQRRGDAIGAGLTVGSSSRGLVGSPDGFVLWRTGITGGGAGEFAYWMVGPNGSPQIAFRSGQQVAGMPDGSQITATAGSRSPGIARGGVVGGLVSITGGQLGIVYGQPGALSMPVRQGIVLPDAPGSLVTSIGAWNLGLDGTLAVVLRANLPGLGQREFLYAGVPGASNGGWGNMRRLATRGEAIPGLPAGLGMYVYGELGAANAPPGVMVGEAGDVVMITLPQIMMPPGPNLQFTAMWYPAPGRQASPQAMFINNTTQIAGQGAQLDAGSVTIDSFGNVVFTASFQALNRRTPVQWSVGRGVRELLPASQAGGLPGEGVVQAVSAFEFLTADQGSALNSLGFPAVSGAVVANSVRIVPVPGACGSIDINGDGLFPSDDDLVCFLGLLAGGTCNGLCQVGNTIDFNNDGLFPDDTDVLAFLATLAGQRCGV